MEARLAELTKIKSPPKGVPGYLIASGIAIPVDGTAGYSPGCIFIDYVGAAIYVNEGTITSCNFDLVSVA